MKLPSEFEARTLEWMGEETYRALEAALQTEPPVSIRVNRTKWSGEVAGEPVLWASAGVYLSQRPTFTFDPLFHAGCYYVQEASSMFVEQVLRTYITGPVVMLDLCAAPGGKSTHARSVLPVGRFIYRNGPLLHSIRCFMLVAIMCKKHLPCLWNRYYALILPDL